MAEHFNKWQGWLNHLSFARRDFLYYATLILQILFAERTLLCFCSTLPFCVFKACLKVLQVV